MDRRPRRAPGDRRPIASRRRPEWSPLGVLAARVRNAIDPTAPETELAFSYPPGRLATESTLGIAEDVVKRFGSSSNAEGVVYSGLEALRQSRRSTPGYGAEADAPVVVAAARDHPAGDDLLSEYIELHASNPYTSYRDRSLWVILQAVACLPNPNQALAHALRLCEGAFAPSNYWFAEALTPSVTARRGGDGAALLGDRRSQALDAASRLSARAQHPQPYGHHLDTSDQWSYHRRRLGAHAETIALSDNAIASSSSFRSPRSRPSTRSCRVPTRCPRKPPWCACRIQPSSRSSRHGCPHESWAAT